MDLDMTVVEATEATTICGVCEDRVREVVDQLLTD